MPASKDSIFVCYRRDDTADTVGRIADRLTDEFGDSSVFKDVDSLPLGADFRAHIQGVLSNCAVVLVIIGPKWVESKDNQGRRRLDSSSDLVRIEIETALLNASTLVIPILINEASMPGVDDLPNSLGQLAYRHAAKVRRDPDFKGDMEKLIKHIKSATEKAGPASRTEVGGTTNLRRKRVSSGATLNVISIREARDYGLTPDTFMKQIIDIDYSVFGDIPIEHEGTLNQWLEKWSSHPESGRAIATNSGQIVGYWSTACLFDDDFSKMKAGQLFDADLKPHKLRSFELPGIYKLYFVTIAIEQSYRTPQNLRMLIPSFIDVLTDLARQGIYFDEMCANAYTAKGESLCRSMGMRYLIDHKDDGRIFWEKLMPPPRNELFSSHQEFFDLYAQKSKQGGIRRSDNATGEHPEVKPIGFFARLLGLRS